MTFEIIHGDESTKARAGLLTLPSGTAPTPFFMPVATRATIKTLDPSEVPKTDVLISNAFLLHLRPGDDIIKGMGGLHKYMAWKGCIFTDSGGFQLIRQGFEPKVVDEGVYFKSPFDGKVELITPEKVLEIEDNLGADVGMILDHCPPYPSTPEKLADSARRTYDWAVRSLACGREKGLMFAIVQGGTDVDLRRSHAKEMGQLDFDGFGIGGLSIGESPDEMFSSLEASLSGLPTAKPRYFMGLGTDIDIIRAVSMGVDIFDSVYPTRNARHKSALIPGGRLNLGKGKYQAETAPIHEDCECETCKTFSLGYVNNLLRDDEMLGMRLLSVHNLHHVQTLMENIRTSLAEGTFAELFADNIGK